MEYLAIALAAVALAAALTAHARGAAAAGVGTELAARFRQMTDLLERFMGDAEKEILRVELVAARDAAALARLSKLQQRTIEAIRRIVEIQTIFLQHHVDGKFVALYKKQLDECFAELEASGDKPN